MTGKELLAIRKRLQLSQALLAKRLGVHRVTVAKWEAGTNPVPEMAAKLMRLIAEMQK